VVDVEMETPAVEEEAAAEDLAIKEEAILAKLMDCARISGRMFLTMETRHVPTR